MNQRRILLIAGAAVVAVTLAACGHHRFTEEDVADHAGWMVEKVSRDLDLTTAQKEKLESVKGLMLTAAHDARARHDADRKELLALLGEPTLDRARANALVTNHTRAIEARAPEVIAAIGDFYDSLTPEQQKAMREHIDSRMDHQGWH